MILEQQLKADIYHSALHPTRPSSPFGRRTPASSRCSRMTGMQIGPLRKALWVGHHRGGS